MNAELKEKYDVAISFLAEDESIALEIYNELSQMLNIFIYSNHQEELAGSDGVEAFRSIFKDRTKLIVVLYREGWGKSDWTNVEEEAIKEFGLKNHWEGITLIKLDDSDIPSWMPSTKIYLDFQKFTLEEIIGSIKSRAQERGSILKPITAIDKAKILENKNKLLHKRNKFLKSPEGVKAALEEVAKLFDEIDKICNKITSERDINFKFGKERMDKYYLRGSYHDDKEGSFGYSINVIWQYKYKNTLDDSCLIVQKINLGNSILREEPRLEEELLYDFELSPILDVCWKDKQNKKPINTFSLADKIVQFIIDFKMPKLN